MTIREKIARKFHEGHRLEDVTWEKIYVVDWTSENSSRGVEILPDPPAIHSVCVHNSPRIPVVFDAFGRNALPIKRGVYSKQCEGVLFPSGQGEHWVLFIETKYAKDRETAMKEDYGYPHTMVLQIIETVEYFRKKEIIGEKQKVHAIVSFPRLKDSFHEELFARLQERPLYGNHVGFSENFPLTVENIRLKLNIIIRGCNSATIDSMEKIRLRVSTDVVTPPSSASSRRSPA
jgi:hypothetical protein